MESIAAQGFWTGNVSASLWTLLFAAQGGRPGVERIQIPLYGSKDFRSQSGHSADPFRDLRKRFQGQMTVSRPGHRPRRGINLHERNLCPRLFQFLQSRCVLLDFRRRRRLAIDCGKQALNNHGTLTGDHSDIAQGFCQRDRRDVSAIQPNPATFSDSICEDGGELTGRKMCSPCGLPESRRTDC